MNVKDLADEPPYYLKGVSRYMWRRLVPFLKQNTNANEMDRMLVEALLENYQILRQSYESINKSGPQYEVYDYLYDDNNKLISKTLKAIKKNPAVDNLDKATKNIRAISSELSLTPFSRSELLKISQENQPKQDIGKEMKEFLGS